MTVAELIARLQTLPPDAPVISLDKHGGEFYVAQAEVMLENDSNEYRVYLTEYGLDD